MRRALLIAALLLPWEAHTSGSSTVVARGEHLSISLESVRKIFAGDGEREAEWHAEWRAENQPVVDAALAAMEPALLLVASADGLALAPFGEELPQAWAWVGPDDPRSPAKVCAAGPCRVELQIWTAGVPGVPFLQVEVALAAPPPDGALDRTTLALARAVAP